MDACDLAFDHRTASGRDGTVDIAPVASVIYTLGTRSATIEGVGEAGDRESFTSICPGIPRIELRRASAFCTAMELLRRFSRSETSELREDRLVARSSGDEAGDAPCTSIRGGLRNCCREMRRCSRTRCRWLI